MNNGNLDILNLCMEDDLFCALYDALCYFEKEWHTASPVDLWVDALQERRRLSTARRPDLLLGQMFADSASEEALLVEALLMWMLFTEDWNTNVSPLKDSLSKLLMAHGDAWNTVYEKFRESESQNEQMGYRIAQCDYRKKEIPMVVREEEHPNNDNLAHELVTVALDTHSPDLCRALYYILSHIDYQKGHIYESEVRRLSGMTDGIEKAAHEPRKIEKHNHFEKDSVRLGAGSTLNGNVHICNADDTAGAYDSLRYDNNDKK